MVGGSRYLALLAVIGSFFASVIVQVYGLIRVVGNACDAYIGRDFSDHAARELPVDAASVIDLFRVGMISYVLSLGFVTRHLEVVPSVAERSPAAPRHPDAPPESTARTVYSEPDSRGRRRLGTLARRSRARWTVGAPTPPGRRR